VAESGHDGHFTTLAGVVHAGKLLNIIIDRLLISTLCTGSFLFKEEQLKRIYKFNINIIGRLVDINNIYCCTNLETML
jgi:hypothetical protein